MEVDGYAENLTFEVETPGKTKQNKPTTFWRGGGWSVWGLFFCFHKWV